MHWVPDGGQIIIIVVTGGLSYVARMLFKTGRLLGQIEERLNNHDRRLDRLEGVFEGPLPRSLDSMS
jgi:hypothetical protein